MATRLRIRKIDDHHISLEALRGVTHYGFGTFLEDIQPKEIDADAFSKQALLSAQEKSGLNGLEVWKDNRIAWGDSSHKIIMPLAEISVHKGASVWMKLISVAKRKP